MTQRDTARAEESHELRERELTRDWALFMSSLVRQEKLASGMEGADLAHTMALVLAGLPTIRTWTPRQKRDSMTRHCKSTLKHKQSIEANTNTRT